MEITILEAVAQAECERILERTNEGHLEAMSNGVSFDRSPRIYGEHVLELQHESINNTELLNGGKKTSALFTRQLEENGEKESQKALVIVLKLSEIIDYAVRTPDATAIARQLQIGKSTIYKEPEEFRNS